MQVNKKENSSISSTYVITVSPSEIEQEVDLWLGKKAETVKMDGFRKGKVPKDIIRRQYLDQAEAVCIKDLIQKASDNIVKEEKITLSIAPVYSIKSYSRGAELVFELTIERLPDFELSDHKKLNIEKIVCEVSQQELDNAYNRFASKFRVKTEVDRPVQEGDIVLFSCETTVGGKLVEELSHEEERLPIGFGLDSFQVAISDAMIGKSAGEEFELTTQIPKDVEEKRFAGKRAAVKGKVLSVSEMRLSEVNEETIQTSEFKTIDALKESLAKRLNLYRDLQLNACWKRAVLDALADEYSFDVPESVVAKDFAEMWRDIREELAHAREIDDEDVRGKTDEEVAQEYRDLSRRRVRLGLVIGKICNTSSLEISPDMINRAIESQCLQFPMMRGILQDYYFKNPSSLQRFVPELLESLVVKKILEEATVTEKTMSLEELFAHLKEILPDDEYDRLVDGYKYEYLREETQEDASENDLSKEDVIGLMEGMAALQEELDDEDDDNDDDGDEDEDEDEDEDSTKQVVEADDSLQIG
ncbi:MAG: trigger factor [Holosporales bacterium]|jgi:trigger factor|nr:trigger factor [Holosporales bacterium]